MNTNRENECGPMPDKTLEQVLIALQKSISRVNSMSSKVPPSQARALILGDIDFDISLKCDQDGDKLRISNSGGISLNLKGIINTDMDITHEEEG
ncbi:hypothetical protein RJ45_21400 [Photobacterium gaetbulicola]|uniref:Uncharacterized protein n=1 Tax=Photobacterium gaetbulicola TaxID=1295392 RepID=A0A0B9GSC1_9GAMM|nr:hypothetical protein [Photobacterium gaetbulicola]KHT61671.1 hypothetical protein RJ45_21400 [Photobacterium gaetbulicola]